MELIKATNEDLETLLEIDKLVAGTRMYKGYNKQEIEERIKNDFVFLAKQDDNIVGTISYKLKDEQTAQVKGFVIKPQYRSQGFGEEALRLLLEKLKNYKQVELVTHPDNGAVKMYKAFGFATKQRIENFHGDGEPRIIMVKEKNNLCLNFFKKIVKSWR